MIACSRCTKSFTFAEVRGTEISLIELGRREVAARGLQGVSDEEIAEWAEGMAETLACFEVGDIVVYLDGSYWTVDSTDVVFDGLYASHNLERLPHAEAFGDPAHLDRMLGNPRYWLDRERSDRDPA